jgi:hypothetical protein
MQKKWCKLEISADDFHDDEKDLGHARYAIYL